MNEVPQTRAYKCPCEGTSLMRDGIECYHMNELGRQCLAGHLIVLTRGIVI